MAQIAAITAAEMPWEVEFEFPLPLPLPFVPFPPPFGSTPPVDPGIIAVDPSVGMNVRIAEPPLVPVAPGRTTLFEKVVTTPFASVETPAKMTPISVSMPSLNDDIPETVASVEAASPESEPDCEAGGAAVPPFPPAPVPVSVPTEVPSFSGATDALGERAL